MRRGRFLGIAALAGTIAAAACFPSFTGLSDGPDAALPQPEIDANGDDGGGDELGPVSDDGGTGFDVVTDGSTPPPNGTSCKDAHDRGLASVDGVVLIDPDGFGPYKAFEVYCKDMSSAPKEYLTLVETSDPSSGSAEKSGSNVTTWAMGSVDSTYTCFCLPDDVRAFTRVRLDVSKSPVRIVTNDLTYSSTNRAGNAPNACETLAANKNKCQAFGHPASNFGVGSACVAPPSTITGRANVDLRGTPFHIALNEHGHLEGFQPYGATTYVDDGPAKRKQAEVTGGGDCGYGFAGGATDTLAIEED